MAAAAAVVEAVGGVDLQGDTICTAQCTVFLIHRRAGTHHSSNTGRCLLSLARGLPSDQQHVLDGPDVRQAAARVFFDSTMGKRRLTTMNTKSVSTAPSTRPGQELQKCARRDRVTVVVNDGALATPGPNDYKVVLKFEGTKVTITSVGKN
jgi:hypothetical protein